MVGKSLVAADEKQRAALERLARSRERGEADRARAILLTLSGWTSPRIAEAFGVREDTVQLWRSDFMGGGVEALKSTIAPGSAPVKTEAALRVVAPLLEAPVADRPNWTIARLGAFSDSSATPGNGTDGSSFKPDGNATAEDHDPSTIRMLNAVEFGARLGQCTERLGPVVENVSGKGLVDGELG
ncbi:hypothetical protein GGD50_005327 [Rhizobium paranaense]|uniref:Helix-turn-helix domain-containing protein n=1 Tax=Rhizobium paranaense TaxID=1650438 RepID=A0A7W8XW62_9HYPH|nr:hypothetical protein [Rhizobium paranaense]